MAGQAQMRAESQRRKTLAIANSTKCRHCGQVGMIPIDPNWHAFKVLLKICSLGLLALVMPGWVHRCPKCGYKQGIFS